MHDGKPEAGDSKRPMRSATRFPTATTAKLRIEALEGYGVPADIIEIWRETIGAELLPVQAHAVLCHGLLSTNDSVIIYSPTSSGKTLNGEMAAIKAAREGTRSFYLVPQRALAEEKYLELRERYGRLGIEVVVSSSDHREHDDAIARGDFHIAIVVFEKLEVLLVRRPELLDLVGLVVVDELQLLTDPERGPGLEILLTKLRMAPTRPRILGLSAVLGRPELLADWLGARLLVDTARPVELRKGVLSGGTFRYLEHNTGAEGEESFISNESKSDEEIMIGAIDELARREEQVLVFLPDRNRTVQLAHVLADRLALPPAEQALAALDDQEETHVQQGLRQALRAGVAFHNSDLSAEERAIVERGFRSGAIRVLCSTSTLAVGMNLPAKNVVVDLRKWKYDKRLRHPAPATLSKSEYENMSGRAGRLAFASDFGRSILVARTAFQADVLMRTFVRAEFEPVGPMLADRPLENHVLNLLTSGLAHTRAELEQLLLGSFTGFLVWRQAPSTEPFAAALDRAVAVCIDGGLVHATPDGDLLVTDLGRACAAKGIDVATGVRLARWTQIARERPVRALEILLVLGRTPAGQGAYVPMSQTERFQQNYRAKLRARMRVGDVADVAAFERLVTGSMALDYEDAVAVKKALVLCDWIAETPTTDLERGYFVSGGMLRRLGGEYAWLVEGLGAIAQASDWPKERCEVFDVLAERLVHGMKADALPLARLRVRSLRRAHIRALVGAGFGDVEALRAADPAVVAGVLQNATAFASLVGQLGIVAQSAERVADATMNAEGQTGAQSVDPPGPAVEETLVIDLQERRVTFRGEAIPTRGRNNLQRQPLFALACLATRPGKMVPMEEVARYVHQKARLPGVPVPSEARDLRYRMLRPLRHHLPSTWKCEIERLVEVVQGAGLRLNVDGGIRLLDAPSVISSCSVERGDQAPT